MILNLYSVEDLVAEMSLQPFYARTHAEALRIFEEAANSEGHAFNKNPQDYRLTFVGSFDGATGLLFAADHVHLGRADSFIAPQLSLPDQLEREG